MATQRRVHATEKTAIDTDAAHNAAPSNITPAVPSSVIAKLLGFTFAMITFPIGSYFLAVNTIFNGNATYAGGLAAIVANVVLIGYCIVAFQDDKSEREANEAERKKSR
ncbi:hypothetical protein EJ03DRAFT_281423 [Teratosphaeria nubilosa]|uniref:Uncharacterized protein n=1 Tax=Teratosphaeria nubilosa TaxID=161662 RepID=A0A6G1KX69_9PEZI|nr:hypothetical protein EJ03DRAFT_281423 [Teratosphaeria nubilosa]